LDGKGFSKLTKLLDKPFDDGFSDDMDTTAHTHVKIFRLNCLYQSDEITIVMTDLTHMKPQLGLIIVFKNGEYFS
jgi:tRNA(His) 5'-end guanylyltransferase